MANPTKWLTFPLFCKPLQSCMERSNKIQPGSVEHGSVQCKGSTCKLDCDNGFSPYGGYNRARCIQNRKTGKTQWSRQNLGECRTCDQLQINTQQMTVSYL